VIERKPSGISPRPACTVKLDGVQHCGTFDT
jgi:hypothetical protein